MRRKPKEPPDAPLAPVPSEILDQFVRQGPIPHQELDAALYARGMTGREIQAFLAEMNP